jgi:hypothetical protein
MMGVIVAANSIKKQGLRLENPKYLA